MAKQLKDNKAVSKLKQGFQDIQTVAQEGNFKLFLKQFIVVLIVFLLFRHLSGKFAAKVQNFAGQMEAVRVQQVNEQEYERNKKLLMSLEPQFPSVEMKNEWLLSKIIEIFKEIGVAPEVPSTPAEDASNPTYVVSSLQASYTQKGFDEFAKFLAGIESRDEYIRVSNFIVEKNTDSNQVGVNKISMKFNTIFPKEKIAKSMFKDYDRLIAQQNGKEK